MTIDLFAASFICRDAELGAVLQIGQRERREAAPSGLRVTPDIGAAVRAIGAAFGRAARTPGLSRAR